MTPIEFAKFALNRDRLALVGALAAEDLRTQDLVERLDLPRRDVLEWLGLLAVEEIIVKLDDGRWSLRDEALRQIADALPSPPPAAPRVLMGLTEAEQEIMRRYASGQRLVEMPAKRSHRLVVLQRLALEFEPGRHYDEQEVNGILALWNPDYALLRRSLIDEGFMDRDHGEYWRSGGRI